MAYALSTLFTDYDKMLRLNHALLILQLAAVVLLWLRVERRLVYHKLWIYSLRSRWILFRVEFFRLLGQPNLFGYAVRLSI